MLSTSLVIAVAGLSVFFRATENVIDRYQFGSRHASILTISAINNLLPLTAILVPVLLLKWDRSLLTEILRPEVMVFAALNQLTAYIFSIAFRTQAVSQVIIVSKIPDLFIPIGIYFVSGSWVTADYLFSVLTVLVCAPVLVQASASRGPAAWTLPLLCLSLIAQGVLSPLLVTVPEQAGSAWLVYTTAFIFWRLLFSLVPIVVLALRREVVPRPAPAGRDGARGTGSTLIVILRALVTLGTQFTFVLAVGGGRPSLSWPILNSSALVATFLAAAILGERPKRAQVLAVGGILAITVVMVSYG